MPLAPRCLLGPRHIHPGVNTAADYREQQQAAIDRGRAKYPNLEWPAPWRVEGLFPVVYVAGGMLQIRCATPGCGNCPSVSPEWRLALCWDCGAVYESLEIPADLDRAEQVLLCRPVLGTRNWRIASDGTLLPDETVDALITHNLEAGNPVPEWALAAADVGGAS